MSIDERRCDFLNFRSPDSSDGFKIHQLAAKSPPLDLNSVYHYALLCRHFAKTCLIAEREGQLAAFVTAYFPPDRPGTLFVWQVAVDSAFRAQGVAQKLLAELVKRTNPARIETTITPDNAASQRLFTALAQTLGAGWRFEQTFLTTEELGGAHAPEMLFEIQLHTKDNQ
ncbi:MAG: diaminobutyrate acetyltransferase [Campylobacterales bacterium]